MWYRKSCEAFGPHLGPKASQLHQRKNFLARHRDQQLRRSSSVSLADVGILVESDLDSSSIPEGYTG
ncbi:hypothetical protein M513_13396 [Trichuris suis]|uniref:Uncharacterized protein n=1 Tax=Trichuris suis TaxID=68888 RepID=A0A085LL91_9BILA|nr:hypothetical protein M513_13396 [Trichuris suis]